MFTASSRVAVGMTGGDIVRPYEWAGKTGKRWMGSWSSLRPYVPMSWISTMVEMKSFEHGHLGHQPHRAAVGPDHLEIRAPRNSQRVAALVRGTTLTHDLADRTLGGKYKVDRLSLIHI